MLIGVFADAHDHVDNLRHAVREFNRAGCELAVFAGDFVSPIVVPPLRKLRCPLLACYGDNDANRVALAGGLRIVGTVGEPPFGFRTPDGTRILLTHVLESVRETPGEPDVVIYAHSHRPRVQQDESGPLLVNPGETSGWTYRKPSVALLTTQPLEARLVSLPELPPPPSIEE